MTPNSSEDEEELDEHGAKRQDAAHQNREHWRQVPRQLWNLSWNLIDANWWIGNLIERMRFFKKKGFLLKQQQQQQQLYVYWFLECEI